MIRKISGFSLVEVLVAAAILMIVVIAIIGIVRKAREMQVSDSHRRAARAVLDSRLEKQFDYHAYDSITLTIPVRTWQETIDPRQGNALISYDTIWLTASSEAVTVNGNLTNVPVLHIKAKAAWVEPDGAQDSVVLHKILAKAN